MVKKKHKMNGLEKEFEKILKKLKIKYEFHFMYRKKEYDFLLIDYKLLIECDGDYWHVNKAQGFKPVYAVQKRNLRNDKVKNELVKKYREYKLLRFWENDINNHKEIVIEQLKERLLLK